MIDLCLSKAEAFKPVPGPCEPHLVVVRWRVKEMKGVEWLNGVSSREPLECKNILTGRSARSPLCAGNRISMRERVRQRQRALMTGHALMSRFPSSQMTRHQNQESTESKT